MMGFGRENQEKGDIRALWRLLGIDFSDGGEGDEFNPMAGPQPSRGTEKVVWQRYNPFPKLGDIIEPELVFIDHGLRGQGAVLRERSDQFEIAAPVLPRPRLHRGYAGGGQALDRQVAQPPVRQAARTGDAKAAPHDSRTPRRRATAKRSTKWPTAGRRSRRNSTGSPAAATARRPSGPIRSTTTRR